AHRPLLVSSAPTVGPTISVLTVEKLPRPPCFSALSTCDATPLSDCPDSAPLDGTRISTWFCAGSPYACTTMLLPPPGKFLSSALRTCCTDTLGANLSMTTVPPANSTLFGMPLVQITAIPARMITHETTSACTRQRRKL